MNPQQLTAAERASLIDAARTAAARAYCPYSRFRVGAAALGEQGIHTGCNVENASLGLSLCAERSALAAAVAAGNKQIRGVAVACVDAAPGRDLSQLVPCGACRQWLHELAPEAEILILGSEQSFHISELLPRAFSLTPR